MNNIVAPPMAPAWGRIRDSFLRHGQVTPIVITADEAGTKYRVVDGARRFWSAQSLGWQHIECTILRSHSWPRMREEGLHSRFHSLEMFGERPKDPEPQSERFKALELDGVGRFQTLEFS